MTSFNPWVFSPGGDGRILRVDNSATPDPGNAYMSHTTELALRYHQFSVLLINYVACTIGGPGQPEIVPEAQIVLAEHIKVIPAGPLF